MLQLTVAPVWLMPEVATEEITGGLTTALTVTVAVELTLPPVLVAVKV